MTWRQETHATATTLGGALITADLAIDRGWNEKGERAGGIDVKAS
jgi:hypothetical protein